MTFRVEQRHDDLHFLSYRTARDALTGKLETEDGRQLSKSRLEKASMKKEKRRCIQR